MGVRFVSKSCQICRVYSTVKVYMPLERSKMNENILLLFSHFKSLPKLNINLGQFQKLRLQAFANCRVMKNIMGHQFQRRRTCNFIISIFFNDFFSMLPKRIFGIVKSKAQNLTKMGHSMLIFLMTETILR